MNNQTVRPLGLASLFRGMYNRVARELGVNPSYVSRVARGQRRSDAVQAALNKEVNTILARFPRHSFVLAKSKPRRERAAKKSRRA